MINKEKARRLGYYRVGESEFNNKIDALLYSSVSGLEVSWHFNDDTFSSINWRTPITETLPSLYKRRAQQLRDKYDFVSLFYSGGVDSTNVLNAFIDNDIHLDEIVMYRPNKYDTKSNNQDNTGFNIYSEIKYAAIPYLTKYVDSSKTKIRIIDFETTTNQLLADSNLVSQYSHSLYNIASSTISKVSMSVLDKTWNDLYEQGKRVCHIHGCDKPIIKYNIDTGHTFRFRDIMSFNFEPTFVDARSEMISKHQFHELFYWTPDLPEIVIKQCQVIKEQSDLNKLYNFMLLDGYSSENSSMWIASLIYESKAFEGRNLFQTGKTSWDFSFHPWSWLNTGIDNKKVMAYGDIIHNIRQSISEKWFMQHSREYTVKQALYIFDGKLYPL